MKPIKHLKCCFFAKIVNGFPPLTTSAKSSILDVSQGSKCASGTAEKKLFWNIKRQIYYKHVLFHKTMKT